ncbi:acyltransferase family protein, partial [Amnimonas aquatica]
MSNRMRADIQALRALAVLSVVVYHAELDWLPSGYLGVDVFFVISGFVITRLLRAQAETRGQVDLRGFYLRRAWRLLPPAFAVYMACAIASWFFLARDEARDFFAQVLGGIFFAGNMVLAEQTGYFAGEAELKPLLHIWSLGIEEQFYFLWPLIFFLRPAYWWPLALGTLLVSLGLYLQLQDRYPSEAFYYLPFRGWQLL